MFSEEEKERYKRQLMVHGFEWEHQEKLKSSRVLIAGIGGLGGTVAMYLAVAGIGHLSLVHDGNLTYSNLNRQILMSTDWHGKPRVEKAKATLKGINPHVDIDDYNEPTSKEVIEKLVQSKEIDLIIDCRHNFPERRTLNDAALKYNVPMIEAAMNDMEGYLFNVIPGKTPCLNCLYPVDPEWEIYGFPVLGVVSGALGCFSAMEAIKILTGFEEPMLNLLFHYDLGTMNFQKLEISRKEDCSKCQHLY